MIIRKSIIASWIFFAISIVEINAQDDGGFDNARGSKELRIMFYNVENLFNTFDDPAVDDEEFTPEGVKHWTYYRYKEKLNNLAKTIIAVGGWSPPEVIGLCEAENFQVLQDLTNETPLKSFGYQIIHENSVDSRGIVVALLYLPGKLTKFHQEFIRTRHEKESQTRDILFATLSIQNKDTFSIYVNHWPSRFGGQEQTQEKRIAAAKVLKSHFNEKLSKNPSVRLVIMGDFNDEPGDESLHDVLGAQSPSNLNRSQNDAIESSTLYNQSCPDFQKSKGTLTFKEIDHTWFLFDQIIVPGALLREAGLQVKGMEAHIYTADWLLENGRPKRTCQGPIYKGGFSDHLPIFVDLYHTE